MNPDNLTKQEELEALLTGFHIPSFAKHYQGFARQAEKERIDHVGYLYQLAKTEYDERYHRRSERLIRQAKLPRGKSLQEFDTTRFQNLSELQLKELSDGSCLDKAENIRKGSGNTGPKIV